MAGATMDRINRMDRMLNEMEAAVLFGKSHLGLYPVHPVHPVNSWGEISPKHSRIEPLKPCQSAAMTWPAGKGQTVAERPWKLARHASVWTAIHPPISNSSRRDDGMSHHHNPRIPPSFPDGKTRSGYHQTRHWRVWLISAVALRPRDGLTGLPADRAPSRRAARGGNNQHPANPCCPSANAPSCRR